MYNDIEEGDGVFVNVTPVDYLSAALVHLALSNPPKEQKSDGGAAAAGSAGSAGDVAAFHLVHGGGVVRLSFLVELLRRRGYTVRMMMH